MEMKMKKIIITTVVAATFTATASAQFINNNFDMAYTPAIAEQVIADNASTDFASTSPSEFTNLFIPGDMALVTDANDALDIALTDPNYIDESAMEAPKAGADTLSLLSSLRNNIADYARGFMGTPYVWGAKGPRAFDCSGFTGYVFKNFGVNIGSHSRAQATYGKQVDIADAKVGDLMFFSRPKGGKTVGHVGMVVDVDRDNGTLKFIHASSRKGVVVQQFPDNGHYNKRFLQIRRVIDEDSPLMAIH